VTISKNKQSSRTGRAAEHLIAAISVLATGEELNALTALVDDEGVDLSFKRRNGTRTLDVQVKARFSDAEGSKALREHDSFAALVGEPTFHRATISTCSTSPSMVRRAP
jgi:glycerate-2-kinase